MPADDVTRNSLSISDDDISLPDNSKNRKLLDFQESQNYDFDNFTKSDFSKRETDKTRSDYNEITFGHPKENSTELKKEQVDISNENEVQFEDRNTCSADTVACECSCSQRISKLEKKHSTLAKVCFDTCTCTCMPCKCHVFKNERDRYQK